MIESHLGRHSDTDFDTEDALASLLGRRMRPPSTSDLDTDLERTLVAEGRRRGREEEEEEDVDDDDDSETEKQEFRVRNQMYNLLTTQLSC